MKKITKLLMAVSAALTISASPASAAEFSDVPGDHWAHDIISELADQNVISGMGDGTYEPESTLTRAQTAKLLVCAMNIYDAGSASYRNVFIDVPETEWYGPYIASGLDGGLYAADTSLFYPDSPITRMDTVRWIVDGLGLSTTAECSYSDVTDSSDRAALAAATQLGLIQGYEDGTFGPDNQLTRAEGAAIVQRVMNISLVDKAAYDSASDTVVMQDNVKYVTDASKNRLVSSDASNYSVTLENIDDTVKNLKQGDILYIPPCTDFAEGFLAKITRADISADRAVLYCEQPKFEEVIKSVDISTVIETSPEDVKSYYAISNEGIITAEGGEESDIDAGAYVDIGWNGAEWGLWGDAYKYMPYHYETENYADKDGAYAAADLSLTIDLYLHLDMVNVSAENVEIYADVTSTGDFVGGYSASGTAAAVYELKQMAIPVCGPLSIVLQPYIEMNADGSFNIEFTAGFETSQGLNYDNGAFTSWNDADTYVGFSADAEGSIEVGPQIDIDVSLCGTPFFDGAKLISGSGSAGVGVNGKTAVDQNISVSNGGISYEGHQNTPDENGVLHTCYICFNGDFYAYAEGEIGLSDDINSIISKLGASEVKKTWDKYTKTLGHWHYSAGDGYGPEFELAECPHKAYEITVTTSETDSGDAITGAAVSIGGENGITDSNGEFVTYLENGVYTAAASAEGYSDGSAAVTVAGERNAVNISLKEDFSYLKVYREFLDSYSFDGKRFEIWTLPTYTRPSDVSSSNEKISSMRDAKVFDYDNDGTPELIVWANSSFSGYKYLIFRYNSDTEKVEYVTGFNAASGGSGVSDSLDFGIDPSGSIFGIYNFHVHDSVAGSAAAGYTANGGEYSVLSFAGDTAQMLSGYTYTYKYKDGTVFDSMVNDSPADYKQYYNTVFAGYTMIEFNENDKGQQLDTYYTEQ